MKIIKRICFVIILAGILLGAMILVPFYKHVNTRYAVTIYDFHSNEELQYMEARVSGEYEYYLFGINSRTRLNCDVVVLDADDKELQYYPAVSAYTTAGGGPIIDLSDGEMNSLGTVTEARNPLKSGKIVITQQDGTCYALYERITLRR